ncbi:transcription repressor [Entomophthora muscae]|uniref:Transcription repressor n=1 Tax=Entomophthora muscae TaxID=34485 RepID=A0ACC2TZK6_9FUNG|nr:transcription repressor [Entomophthora muscae]
MTQDSSVYKMQREEFEHKITAQMNEMSAFQQNLYELDRNHQKIKQQYEEEIMRLRREIEQRGGHPPGGPGTGHPQHPPPNIGHGPSSLFGSIVGAPPQLIDPSQTQQPQQHPSFPPPSSSNPTGSHYLNGGPPGSQPPPLSHPSQIPPGGPGLHLSKRVRSDSDAGALPMMQPGGPGSSMPPGFSNNPNQPPGSHHMPPGMHPHQPNNLQGKMTPNQNQPPPGAPALNPSESGHPSHHPGGPHLSSIPPGVSQSSMTKRKNGGTPGSVPSINASRPSIKQSPAPGSAMGSAPPVVTGLSDLDPESVPAQHKREGGDWFAIFNPKIPRALNVDLVSTLDHNSVVCCVRFSSDGKYLATGCNRTAQIYDAATSQKICVLVDDSVNKNDDLYIRSVCFSPDGKYLATGAEDKLIRIWDIKKKFIVHLFQGHEQDIYSLDFSRDGRFIVSGSGDRTARLWDMETRKCLFTLAIDDMSAKDAGVTSVALSPEGRYVAAGSLDKLVRVWDTHTGQLLDKLEGHKDSVYSVAFSADGKTLCSGSLDKTLKLWELSSLNRGATPGQKGGSTCRNTFVGHKDFVLSVACSPCGNWVVSGSKDRGVQFWDPRTAQTQFMLQGHKNSVISVALSPAGRLFATGSGDCRARLWSYENITPLNK